MCVYVCVCVCVSVYLYMKVAQVLHMCMYICTAFAHVCMLVVCEYGLQRDGYGTTSYFVFVFVCNTEHVCHIDPKSLQRHFDDEQVACYQSHDGAFLIPLSHVVSIVRTVPQQPDATHEHTQSNGQIFADDA